jgi:hypothetical protein
VTQWLQEQDLIFKAMDGPNPAVIKLFETVSTSKQDKGAYHLNVIFPAGLSIVILSGRTDVAQYQAPLWEKLSPADKFKFQLKYQEMCVAGYLLPHIHMETPPYCWVLTSEIYFDGLTQDRFFRRYHQLGEIGRYLSLYFYKTVGNVVSLPDGTVTVAAPVEAPAREGPKMDVNWEKGKDEGDR